MKIIVLFLILLCHQSAFSQQKVDIVVDSINYCNSIGKYNNADFKEYRIQISNNENSDVLVWLADKRTGADESGEECTDSMIHDFFYAKRIEGLMGNKLSRDSLFFRSKPIFVANKVNTDCFIKRLKPKESFFYIIIGENINWKTFRKSIFYAPEPVVEKVIGREIPQRILYPLSELVVFENVNARAR